MVSLPLTAIPEYTESQTLLGMDFSQAARMILIFSRKTWSFAAHPTKQLQFYQEDYSGVPVSVGEVRDLQPYLPTMDDPDPASVQKQKCTDILSEYANLFSPRTEPTQFAEHVVTLLEDIPIAVQVVTCQERVSATETGESARRRRHREM